MAAELGLEIPNRAGLGKIWLLIFEQTVEKKLRDPTFITGYPTEVSPLSRRNDANPFITDRFELFVAGREIANGFSELNDPDDQAERFRAQVAERNAGDEEAMSYDSDYVRALEYALPPTGGEGIGIDSPGDAAHGLAINPGCLVVPPHAPGARRHGFTELTCSGVESGSSAQSEPDSGSRGLVSRCGAQSITNRGIEQWVN